MGAVAVAAQHLRTIDFAPYTDVITAVAVPGPKRYLFAELQTIRDTAGLTLAVVNSHATREFFNLLVEEFPMLDRDQEKEQ